MGDAVAFHLILELFAAVANFRIFAAADQLQEERRRTGIRDLQRIEVVVQ